MNEGSSSRLYSFNIYLYFDVIYYHRYYKKVFFIKADGLPIATGIFTFFGIIAEIFKISSENQKLIELLFEKRQSQHSKSLEIENNFKNLFFKKNSIISIKENISDNSPKIKNKTNLTNNKRNNPNTNLPSANMNSSNKNEHIIEENIVSSGNKNDSSSNKNVLITNQMNKDNINKDSAINNYSYITELYNDKKGKQSLSISQKEFQKNNINKEIDTSLNEFVNDNQSKKKKLFPYKYYLCTIFIKNVNKNSSCFSKEFIEVYQFISQLMDISSYLVLQKQFEILKDNFMIDKYRDILENLEKINVNEQSFDEEMKEYLETKKLTILGKIRSKE